MRVLERFCSFEMCLDIEYFVRRETWSFGISENSAFGHFKCEFDCGMESVSETNEIADFLFAWSPYWKDVVKEP